MLASMAHAWRPPVTCVRCTYADSDMRTAMLQIIMWDRSTMRTTVTLGEVLEGITCCQIVQENDFVVVGSAKVSAWPGRAQEGPWPRWPRLR